MIQIKNIRNNLPVALILWGSYFLVFISPVVKHYAPSNNMQMWAFFPILFLPLSLLYLNKFYLHEFFVTTMLSYAVLSWLFFYINISSPYTSITLYSLSALSFLIAIKVFEKSEYRISDNNFCRLTIVVILYAIVQFLSYRYNLGLVDPNMYRGRDFGTYNQITSFFYEPAFLALFCLSFLYYNYFVRPVPRQLLTIAIIVTAFASQSLSAIISTCLLSLIFLLSGKKCKTWYLSMPLLIVLVVFFLFYFNSFEIVTKRIGPEVISHIEDIDPDVIGCAGSSGQRRIIGELNYLLFTAKNSPAFGYGVEYNNYFAQIGVFRTMALNAITEIIVRWGVLGIILFSAFLFFEKYKFKPRNLFAFWTFILLYTITDGALSKVEFWLPLAIVLGLERSLFIKNRYSN